MRRRVYANMYLNESYVLISVFKLIFLFLSKVRLYVALSALFTFGSFISSSQKI